jgi:ArsR family transcriptional regulator, arsenate/arsenite/antimonite-responsive transcriptional repressor
MPLSSTFKALSDSTRRKILELLRERDMTAGEIAGQFKISKPSISHHLGMLKMAGLVIDERKGQNMVYSLNTSVLEEVMTWFFEIRERGGDGKEKVA